MSAELMTEIKEEALSYFSDMFEGRLAVDSMVESMARFNESPGLREQETFRCMFYTLFAHYKHLPMYSLKQVKIIAVLYGSLIKHKLATGDTLGIAVNNVLDALKEPPESNISLELFTELLRSQPIYLNTVVQIKHLRAKRPNLVAFIEAILPLKSNFQFVGVTAAAPPRGGSLYVGNLDLNVRDSKLFYVFSQVGRVVSARVCRDPITRCSLGYGYVKYGNPQEAAKAIESFNLAQISTKLVRVMCSSVRKSGTTRVFFKNADESIDEKELYDIFWSFGDIESLEVQTHPSNGESKGFGFVNFENGDDAVKAVEILNGMKIGDGKLRVEIAQQRKEKHEGASVQEKVSWQMTPPFMAPPVYMYNNPPSIIGGQQLFYCYGRYPPMLYFPFRPPPPPRTIGFCGYQHQQQEQQQLVTGMIPGGIPSMHPGGIPSMHPGAAPVPYLFAPFVPMIHQQRPMMLNHQL